MNTLSPLTAPAADGRRAELDDFLRARRADLTPERAGLPGSSHRRTLGLRREEVAEIADISVTLYAWLEQGRNVPVSARAIDAIARALQLTDDERLHVQHLARHGVDELRDVPSHALGRLIESMGRNPALVLDHAWDVIARNAAADAVYGDPAVEASQQHHKNALEFIFVDTRSRALFVDWEAVAEGLLETFRLDFARYPNDARAREVVTSLLERSPEFAAVWRHHRVRAYPRGVRQLAHPQAGALRLETTFFTVTESPNLRLLTLTPYDAETAHKLAQLVVARESKRPGGEPAGPPDS